MKAACAICGGLRVRDPIGDRTSEFQIKLCDERFQGSRNGGETIYQTKNELRPRFCPRRFSSPSTPRTRGVPRDQTILVVLIFAADRVWAVARLTMKSLKHHGTQFALRFSEKKWKVPWDLGPPTSSRSCSATSKLRESAKALSSAPPSDRLAVVSGRSGPADLNETLHVL
jgi:hypothetical protein